MKPLEIVIVDLVQDTCHAPEEEDKVSSSSQRRRLLGELLKPVTVSCAPLIYYYSNCNCERDMNASKS